MKNPEAIFNSNVLSYNRLTPQGDSKHTYHIEIAWPNHISYQVGDSVAIKALNKHQWIEAILPHLTSIEERHQTIQTLLEQVNLKQISSKLIKTLLSFASPHQASQLAKYADNAQELKRLNDSFEVWELLSLFNIFLPAQAFISALSPLHPRFYSIASSQNVTPDKIALTIAHVSYKIPDLSFEEFLQKDLSSSKEKSRSGVCSDFLFRCSFEPDQRFKAWIHPSKDFHLAAPEEDILMIGPGTGVAPFRAFMLERLYQKKQGKTLGKSWLFFGERLSSCFFYEELWQECQKQLDFNITCAFSREGPQKFYVQHALWHERAKVWPFLEKGTLYVCGDAKHMAKDVETTLLAIMQEEGKLSPEDAKNYIKRMRQEKRYLRDIY